jgi:hypothetical protein
LVALNVRSAAGDPTGCRRRTHFSAQGRKFWRNSQSSIGYGAKTGSVRFATMAEPTPPETSVHTDAERARAGETPGITRYILGISLLLAVVILSLIVWGPVLFHQ